MLSTFFHLNCIFSPIYLIVWFYYVTYLNVNKAETLTSFTQKNFVDNRKTNWHRLYCIFLLLCNIKRNFNCQFKKIKESYSATATASIFLQFCILKLNFNKWDCHLIWTAHCVSTKQVPFHFKSTYVSTLSLYKTVLIINPLWCHSSLIEWMVLFI